MFSITKNFNWNFLCFVITCIKFHDTKKYIHEIFQNDKYSELIVWKKKSISLTCKTMPMKYQSLRLASKVRSKKRNF